MEKHSPDELKNLAAQVVDKILSDESLYDALVDVMEKKKLPECPPRTACCTKSYVCESLFLCTAPFSCMNGHVEKLMRA